MNRILYSVVSVAAILAVSVGLEGATPTSFKAAPTVTITGPTPESNPQSIVEANFFGGTIPGLAVANAGGFVAVFKGNGNGTFLEISTFNTQGPRALAAGDFNNDGCPDLAVVNSYTGVSVWLNVKVAATCTGVFNLSNTYITESVPEAVAVGSFTKNIYVPPIAVPPVPPSPCVDLAVSNNGSNTVTILINECNGTGNFYDSASNPPLVLPTGNGPVGVAFADFNKDGDNDLAVVNSTDGTLTVWLGTGTGSAFFGGTFPLGTIPIRTLNLGQTIAVGDFNHDTYPDIAISTDEGVVVLINSALPPSIPPSVGFLEPPAAPYQADLLPDSVAVGDFNQDGILDLAVTNAISNDVSILIGAGTGGIGNGTFLPPVNFPVGTLPTSVAVGAFNSVNNNYLGVAVTNFGDIPGDVSIYLGTVWTISVVSGSDQGAQVGAPFLKPLVVQVQDTDSAPVPVAGATVTYTAPTFGASAVVSPAPPTNASGQTQATATANDIAGSYNVTAMAGFAATTTFYLTNTGDPAIAAVGGTPQNTAVNTAFPLQLQAKVTDAFGNGISGQSVTFVVSPGVTGASGTLTSPATVPTNSSGIATASITANGTAGTFQVTAGAPGVGQTNFVLTNIGSPTAILAVSGSGQSAGVGQPFAAPLVAKVTDSAGDPISGVTVTFTINPMNGSGATFTGGLTSATAITTSGGTATSPALTSSGTGGTFTVTASASGAGSTAFNLTIASGIIVPNVTVQAGSWTLLPVTLGAPATTTLYVTLTSNNTSIVSMSSVNAQTPATIIFLAGSTTPTFTPKIYGIAGGSTTITATAYGLPSGTGNVQVTQ